MSTTFTLQFIILDSNKDFERINFTAISINHWKVIGVIQDDKKLFNKKWFLLAFVATKISVDT